jgi:hypothetical protein
MMKAVLTGVYPPTRFGGGANSLIRSSKSILAFPPSASS